MPDRRGAHFLIAVIAALLFSLGVSGQTAVTLSPAASPPSGQPGITTINLTGSGFPAGTIQPSAVTVSLKPSTGGTAATTPASAVTTIVGATRRITFTIPASISVTAPTAYDVSIGGTTTTNVGFTSANTASLTVNPAPQILSVAPAAGRPGQSLPVTIAGAFTTFVQGSTVANFGPGISVGGAAEGAAGPVTVSSATSAVAQLAIGAAAAPGPRAVTVSTGVQSATLAAGFTVSTSPLTITSFAPQSGTVGTIVTINGSNFGPAPQVSMPGLSGSSITLPLQSLSASSAGVVIPAGAVTGPITVANSGATASTASPFTVNASNTFSLTASPSTATLIQGQSVAYSVRLASANGFNQLAPLSVSGLPAGISASFKPSSITTGQTSILTLSAPASQPLSTAALSLSAAATVDGIALTQSTSATLAIQAPTTSFIGRAVVADPLQTPLAGVTVAMLGLNGGGASTGCTGNTVSDGAGNFALTNLAANCVGPQLVGFGGDHVTSPAGKYAGVNLVYTLASGQVTVSPVLVHLPRIDSAETFQVQQNAATDQTYSFGSVPGVTVTVYAHTTFTQQDGTQPNPFPLVAVEVPVDRLPEAMPTTNAGVMAFIVAFQPANVTASQPVAVTYPNTLNLAPGASVPLMTLDPTRGRMVPYGTATVSADGAQIIPDIDPSTGALQHRFGIVHFDWHGWLAALANLINPCPTCPAAVAGDPVDLSSGLQMLHTTDISISGTRGSIAIRRVYRTLSTNDGAFGPGHEIQYAWQLNTAFPSTAAAINLISPDGNQFRFSRQANGTLTNSSIPSLQGAVMTTNSNGQTTLRYPNGTVYLFQTFARGSYLSSISDRNGNTTTFAVSPLSSTALRITRITDPVGRSLNLTYNSGAHVASVTDQIGRTVTYTYNSTGALATATDPNGGVARYQYDSQNRMSSTIDPRGVVMFQDSFDANGRVSQQVRPDGGAFHFTYTLANSLVPASPVMATAVTDPLGNQTTYRFNPQGILTDITDALGQTKSFTLSPGTNFVLQISGPAQCNVCGPPGLGTVSYTYDSNGNMLTSTNAFGNTATLTYDSVFNQITSITDPLNHKSTFGYDSSGNLISATDANGHSMQFAYTAGLVTQVTDALGNSTLIGRGSFGNPNSVTDALGNTTATTFDGVSRPVLTVDPLDRRSTVAYDVLDRVTSTRDPRGNTIQLSYDPVDNLLSFTDARGSVTAFTYDSLSRLKTLTSALGRTESFQYDLNGNTVQYADRRGQISQFQYDALNRLVKEQYQDGSTVTRSYDPYSRPLKVEDSQGGVFTFSFDANGRLLSQNEPNGTVQYTRDPLGRVATLQVTGQPPVGYSYDAAGNLLGSSSSAAGVTYSYDVRNLPTALLRTNGVTSLYSVDPLGQLLSLVHAKGSTALNTQTYTYDPSGRRISATNNLAQPLIAQSASATVDQANELLSNGPTVYTHDLNGNRLTETSPSGTLTYAWDSRNRLTSITDARGNVTAFKYDSGRNLTEIDKAAGGVTTTQKFVFDSLTNVVSLTDASGLPVSVLTGRSIDSHYASVDSVGNVAFGIGDPLGSTLGVTNGSGVLTSTAAYDPYGQTASTPPATFPFSFTGRVPVTNNILYLRARFLDTATGRFISEDPAGLVGGVNAYAYVGGNPVSNVDPLGLAEEKEKPEPPNPIDVIDGVKNIKKGIRLFVYGTGIDLTVEGIPIGLAIQGLGVTFVAGGLGQIFKFGKDVYDLPLICPAPAPASDPYAPFGPLNPNTPFGAMNPSTPFGAMNPSTPFGAMNPNTPFGVINPNTPFGAMNPSTPFGPMNPNTPFGPMNSRPITRICPGTPGCQ